MTSYTTTNLRFERQTYQELSYQARRKGVSVASVVREAVAQYLGHTPAAVDLPIGADPFDLFIGVVEGGADDESVNHDQYLYDWPKPRIKEPSMKMLIDTGALLALALRNDRHHRRARAFLAAHPHVRFVLSDLILVEMTTRLRARADAPRAVAAARSLLAGRRYEVIFADAPLLTSALARMEQFDDKLLSVTDCVSFELMDRLGLEAAFAFDDDFRACGYRMSP